MEVTLAAARVTVLGRFLPELTTRADAAQPLGAARRVRALTVDAGAGEWLAR